MVAHRPFRSTSITGPLQNLEGVDRREKKYQLTDAKISQGEKDIGVIGIQNGNEGFFWVYAEKVFNDKRPVDTWTGKAGRIRFNSFSPGTYSLEAWDTYRGSILFKKEVILSEKNMEIDILNSTGIAIKMRRNENTGTGSFIFPAPSSHAFLLPDRRETRPESILPGEP